MPQNQATNEISFEAPARVNRNYWSTYTHAPSGKVYRQKASPNGNQWEEIKSKLASTTPPIINSAKAIGVATTNFVEQYSGPLIAGHKYIIPFLEAGDDFSNVGYIADNVSFIATGTIATVYINNTNLIDETASIPILTILEGDLAITPAYSFGAGNLIKSAGLFKINKTIYNMLISRLDDNSFTINGLGTIPFEIVVYD